MQDRKSFCPHMIILISGDDRLSFPSAERLQFGPFDSLFCICGCIETGSKIESSVRNDNSWLANGNVAAMI